MGVRVVLGIHALVLLAAGALWFLPRNVTPGLAVDGFGRVALLVAAVVGVVAHLGLLLRKRWHVSPSLLTLPLLLPAFAGLAVGLSSIPPLSDALAEDRGNHALQAWIVWAGGAQCAAGMGMGAWTSGVLLLAASVGAAAIMVSRGWVTVPRSVLRGFAIAIALVVASTLVRFSSTQTLLPSDVLAWGGTLATLSLLVLGGRAGSSMGPGWQATLLRSLGLMLPIGTVLVLVGWPPIREGQVVGAAVESRAFDGLDALSSSAQAMDGVVGALIIAAVLVASWAMLSGGRPCSGRGRLALVCTALFWLMVVGSLTFVRTDRARQLSAWSAPLFGTGDLGLPEMSLDTGIWVPEGPTVVVPQHGIARLAFPSGEGETQDLSTAAMSEIPPSHPAPPVPDRADRKNGGCAPGEEHAGIAMPGARLVMDRRLTLQSFSAHLAPLSTTEPRVFALVTLREGAENAAVLSRPWDRVARLASTVSTLVRVESSAARALRRTGDTTSSRYLAIPERGGLRVVSLPSTRPRVDKLLLPAGSNEVGACSLRGCNPRPCEYVIVAPPGWKMERVLGLVELVVRAHHPATVSTYRAHNIVTLTPDMHGVRSLLRDAQGKLGPGR